MSRSDLGEPWERLEPIVNFLSKLRAKNHHEKRRIAFLSATIVTLLLFVFWVSSLGVRIKQISTDGSFEASPFETLKGNFTTLKTDITSQFDVLKNAFK